MPSQTLYRKDWRVCTQGGARPIVLRHLPWTPNEMVGMVAWQDRRCGLAVEDRDLLAEARDVDACLANAAETLLTFYPSTDASSLFPDGKKRHTIAN